MTDNVNHPAHYTQGGIECIDALAAATINLQGWKPYVRRTLLNICGGGRVKTA